MMEEKDFSWYPSPRYLLRKRLINRCLVSVGCEGKSVLEIGFGAGDMLCNFVDLGMKVYGYDFSELANKEAARRLKSRKGAVNLFTSEEEVYTSQYDIVVACEVLEHSEDDVGMLRRWNKLVEKGGYLIISVPSRMKKWCLNDVWAGHYRRYEKKDLAGKLKSAGYEIVNFWSYPFPVNIVLDYLLDKEKKRQSSGGADSKEDATKQSGVKREAGQISRLFSRDWVVAPWHWLQLLFVNTDLGSGYLVMAKKINEE